MVKDQEFLEKKALYCLGLAKKMGATQSSVVVNNSISETVNFRNKKLDESNRSDDLGINITTYIGKKKSSISSSNLLKGLSTILNNCHHFILNLSKFILISGKLNFNHSIAKISLLFSAKKRL